MNSIPLSLQNSENRVATDYTAGMLTEWKRRVDKGEFLEDWQRIVTRKNNFLRQPATSEKYQYKGPHLTDKNTPLTNSIPVTGKSKTNVEPTLWQRAEVYEAALWSLLKADTKNPVEEAQVREINRRIKDLLLFYATTPGLRFSDQNRWDGKFHDLSPGYIISLWVHQLEDVFHVCKHLFSSEEKEIFINWVFSAAAFSYHLLRQDLSKPFKNRSQGNYEPVKPIAYGPPISLHYAGENTYAGNRFYNNRRLAHLPLVAKAGAMQANQKSLGITIPATIDFRKEAEQIYKEAIAFALYPTGECVEMERNDDDKPSQGMGYSFIFFDAIAWVPYYRLLEGDDSLYFYQTSAGILGSEDPTCKTPYQLDSMGKNPKSLLKAIKYQFECMSLAKEVYGTRKTENYTSAQKELFRYDGSGQLQKPEWLSGHFLMTLQANLGFKSAAIRQGCEHPYEAQGRAKVITNKQSDTVAYAGSGAYRPSEGIFGLESCLILKYYGMEALI
ncbi:hypothetical protein GXP67_35470 [Rhodocytophaga rosea]|uniref:Uncharacterized protein n=1 Tax=Rhodocytophaga rosea TaxID=2704465 RepID=A0A6C0GVK9_9BACT|nr:hypothetical protein [Rhodocytophaga rosea]QHT71593.1 hypothetical protein GXP67_35470 [Rhodocytophaga rosea]